MVEAGHQGRMLAEVLGQVDAFDALVFTGQLFDDLVDIVRRGVADQDDFIAEAFPGPDGGPDFVDDALDGLFRTVAWDYKGYLSHLLTPDSSKML